MYYLLDNNKIYDSNNKRDVSSLEFDFQITIENNQLYKYYDRGNWDCDVACSHAGYRCIGCKDAKKEKFIPKKQSENVFDLIEIGDLIECSDSYFTCVKEKSKTYDKHLIFMNNFSIIYDDNILAIYKPNFKGDYIKVWEKK